MKVLIALVLYSLLILPSLAAQNAVIRAEKAYVYSDLDMSTIVGFITQGRQVRVGSTARNQNSVLPIIVSGKVGYIKISDLLLESDNPHLKVGHASIEEAADKRLDKEPFFKNVGFSMSFYSPGADFSLISERVNGASAANMANTYRYYTTFNWDKKLFRASLDQFSFSEVKLKFAPLAPALDYLFHITDFFQHNHLYGAMGVIFPLSLTKGNIYGIRLAPEWVYDLPYNLQLLGAIEYHYFKASGADPIYFSPTTFVVNNIGFNLGLQYRF